MSERKPQSFANHARLDPWFHFFLLPLSAITLITAIVSLIQRPHSMARHFFVAFALMIVVMLFRIRPYALRVQDRVIRLEERLRMAMLLPEPLRARIPEITERQLVALRFASDGELASLVEMALNENLPAREIKKRIQNWRPDYWRV